MLDASEFAQRHDLPEPARFMLATGLRLGEALGVTWADVDLSAGTASVTRTIVRVKGQGLVANRVKSKASERGLLLPPWCMELRRARQVRRGGVDGPVFPDARGGWRDLSNVDKSFRQVRAGSEVEWVETHPPQDSGDFVEPERGERADQLGHSRVSMRQAVYLGRWASNSGNLAALEAYNPDQSATPNGNGEQG